jgi:hypothetical protein
VPLLFVIGLILPPIGIPLAILALIFAVIPASSSSAAGSKPQASKVGTPFTEKQLAEVNRHRAGFHLPAYTMEELERNWGNVLINTPESR